MPWSSVRGLVVSGFAVLVVILAMVTAVAAYQTSRHQSDLEKLDFHSNRAILIQNVETNAAVSGLLLQRYIEAGGDNYPAEINGHAVAAQVSLEAVVNMGNPPAGFEGITIDGLKLLSAAAQATEFRRIGDVEQARRVMEEIVPLFRDYRLTLEAVIADELATVDELRAQADAAGQLTFLLLVISGAAGVVLAIGVSLFIARSIITPLASLETAALAVSRGDFHARATVTHPRELAHLGKTLNTMVSTVQERTEEIEERNRQLLDARALASTDGLTGVLNHRAFQERIREVVAVGSSASPVSLIMLDIDGFKQVNDRLGHQKGDDLLRSCTEACVQIAGRDAVFRYGGDEIAVIFAGSDLDQTMLIGERIRKAIAEDAKVARVTISLGASSYPGTARTADELTYQADAAMYAAKSSGKNRVCRWDEIAQAPPPAYADRDRDSHTLATLAAGLGLSEDEVVSEINRLHGYTPLGQALLESLGAETTPPAEPTRSRK